MRIHLFGVDFRFSFCFFVVAACFLSLDRGSLAVFFVLPILVHELGHLLVMALLGIGVSEVAFTPVSLRVTRRGSRLLPYGQEIAVSLGGAAANLMVALLLYVFCFQSMRTMLIIAANTAVALFNLLPVGNLDGGQLLRLFCSRFFSLSAADLVSRAVSFLVLTLLFAFSIFLLLRPERNFTLLLCCLYLTATLILRNP